MKRNVFTILLALIMLLCAIPVAATETTAPTTPERAPGYCGEAILWEFEDGTLTIIGAGKMDDFPEDAPWVEHKDEIEKVVISNGITYVGARSFYNYDKLKDVEFGDDIYEIGEHAFFSCDALTVICLPESFKVFGPSCFMGCTKLTEFHCQGRFPSFRQNCLWDTYATIYFPADRPWSVEYIQQLEEAFHGRIEFLASDGSDPYEPTEAPEETEAPTEVPTEAPTEAPTTLPPATEAPTEPIVTDTAPTGEAPVEAPTEIIEETEAPTEPEQEEPTKRSRIPLIIIGSVATFLILGSIIFGGGRKRGKYSR